MSADGGGVPRPAAPQIDVVRSLGRKLRIGGIDSLDSRPLLEGLRPVLGDGFDLEVHVPSELAGKLRAGAFDVALAPVPEYFTGRKDYRIVPGVSISSYGAIESVCLFHRKPLAGVERIAIDSSSVAGGLLARLLFAKEWTSGGPGRRFETVSPEDAEAAIETGNPAFDAVLLEGDPALEAGILAESSGEWRSVDLGTEWTRITGLPFVCAFWVTGGPAIPGLSAALQRARDLGRARIDEIVEAGPLPRGLAKAAARRHLYQVIRHELGAIQIDGLLEFRRRAAGLESLAGFREDLLFLEGAEKPS